MLIACDHGGFELKKDIIKQFNNYSFKDFGCSDQSSVDYPDYAHKLIKELANNLTDPHEDTEHFGILICGSGQGMAMTANKQQNVRAALCWSVESAKLARGHNNAQVLCIGARLLEKKLAFEIIEAFLTTPFEGGRHVKRINKI